MASDPTSIQIWMGWNCTIQSCFSEYLVHHLWLYFLYQCCACPNRCCEVHNGTEHLCNPNKQIWMSNVISTRNMFTKFRNRSYIWMSRRGIILMTNCLTEKNPNWIKLLFGLDWHIWIQKVWIGMMFWKIWIFITLHNNILH